MIFNLKGNAINYSGYRDGQSPLLEMYPTEQEIYEDLKLLEGEYRNLRIYDCSLHAYRVLKVIEDNNLDFKVMLGLSMYAEENHINHPYYYHYSDEEINNHRVLNEKRVNEIIDLSIKYTEIVNAISIGNEVRSPWNNNRVPVSRLMEIAKVIQMRTKKPVTFVRNFINGLWN